MGTLTYDPNEKECWFFVLSPSLSQIKIKISYFVILVLTTLALNFGFIGCGLYIKHEDNITVLDSQILFVQMRYFQQQIRCFVIRNELVLYGVKF